MSCVRALSSIALSRRQCVKRLFADDRGDVEGPGPGLGADADAGSASAGGDNRASVIGSDATICALAGMGASKLLAETIAILATILNMTYPAER